MKYIVVDCETGGLDPKVNALLEIGARLYEDDGKMINAFNKRIMWDSSLGKVSTMALAINGLNLAAGDSAHLVARELAAFLVAVSKEKDVSLLGHNLQFDCDFISVFLERFAFVNWTEPFRHRKVDTQYIALFLQESGLLPGYLKLHLNSLHKHFFGTDIPNAHTSLGDVEATFAVYREMRRLLRERVSWDSTKAVEVKK